MLPTAAASSQCMNNTGNVPSLTANPVCTAIGQKNCVTQPGFPVASALSPGLAYNLTMRDGTITDGTVTFLPYPIPAINSSVDFLGAYNRIHQTETVLGKAAAGCQMADMTDQIACLTQADPCSIGLARDAGRGFSTNPDDINEGPGTPGGVDSARVAQIYPRAASVQLLGQAGEYQLAHKLYFNSLAGFPTVAAGLASGDKDEFLLAQFEASGLADVAGTTDTINDILQRNARFTLGQEFVGNAGTDPQFCEDFDEETICMSCDDTDEGGQLFCTPQSNANGCLVNTASATPGIPGGVAGAPSSNLGAGANQSAGTSTICGDGVRQAYEECDNGSINHSANGHALGNSDSDTAPGGCSLTCRCVNDFVAGACN